MGTLWMGACPLIYAHRCALPGVRPAQRTEVTGMIEDQAAPDSHIDPAASPASARAQATAWRNGLTAAAALLAAALIVRGPEDLADLHWIAQVLAAALLLAGFALLVRAILAAAAAAAPSAEPGAGEVASARRYAVTGLGLV